MDILFMPGIWRRAALDGRPYGIDYPAALVAAGSGCDPDRLTLCLARAEAAMIAVIEEKRSSENG